MMSAQLRTYAARVFRDDDLWVIEVPELDTVSQSRTLASAEEEARALVGVWLDVPAEQVAVRMDYSAVDPDAWRLASEARTAQAQADELARRAAATRRRAAQQLVRETGLSLRDAAAVLGVTFSRVQQLLKDEITPGAAR
jgi:predicted RNase H-like HicB family nuclease